MNGLMHQTLTAYMLSTRMRLGAQFTVMLSIDLQCSKHLTRTVLGILKKDSVSQNHSISFNTVSHYRDNNTIRQHHHYGNTTQGSAQLGF